MLLWILCGKKSKYPLFHHILLNCQIWQWLYCILDYYWFFLCSLDHNFEEVHNMKDYSMYWHYHPCLVQMHLSVVIFQVFVYIPTSSRVLHAILWPSIALGFGLFSLVVVVFSSCEVWVCMPWRNKQHGGAGHGAAAHNQGAPRCHKHSYELATVKYGHSNEEQKSAYTA